MDGELVTDSLVYRYDPEASPDGLRGSEGTFSLCTFAYVDALTRAGRLDDARRAFEKMLTYANHVGLYSEEIALTGEQIGNFPQAFTHLALIDAAITLDAALDGPLAGGDIERVAPPAPAVAAARAACCPWRSPSSSPATPASNMNVAISTIADDLGTDVTGIQTTITLFTLTMAALMIPGSKLTDIWGRKFCFIARAGRLRRRRAARRARPGPAAADRRLLAARGRRLGAAHPARSTSSSRSCSPT